MKLAVVPARLPQDLENSIAFRPISGWEAWDDFRKCGRSETKRGEMGRDGWMARRAMQGRYSGPDTW